MACILKTGLAVALISITMYEIFPMQIVKIFMEEPETLWIGTHFLEIRAIAAAVMFFCFFAVFVFQAVGDGKMSMRLTVLRWICLNIPMLFVMNGIIGMYGIAWAAVISDVLTMIISFVVLKRYMHKWENPSA